jgi:hypothetical protein
MAAWFGTGRARPPTDAQREVIHDFLEAFDVTGMDRLGELFRTSPADPIGALLRELAPFREERKAAAMGEERRAARRRAEQRRPSIAPLNGDAPAGRVAPPAPGRVCSCGKPLVQAAPERWVCTNPAHPPAVAV